MSQLVFFLSLAAAAVSRLKIIESSFNQVVWTLSGDDETINLGSLVRSVGGGV